MHDKCASRAKVDLKHFGDYSTTDHTIIVCESDYLL